MTYREYKSKMRPEQAVNATREWYNCCSRYTHREFYHACPDCGSEVKKIFNFCPTCAKKLDWSYLNEQ